MTEVAFVLGTESEAVRLAPVIRACERRGVDHAVIHTGEHGAETLERSVFDGFDVPSPDIALDVGSGPHGRQTGTMLAAIERALAETDPAVAVVHGDTNSALAGAVAASKMRPKVAHVEAGLRSFDRSAPAETNRVIADHVADYLFATTEKARWYLVREGVTELRITVTGSTAVDALERVRDRSRPEREVLDEFGIRAGGFLLVDVRRRGNADDPGRFRAVLDGAARAGSAHGLEVVRPVRPRARERSGEVVPDGPAPVRTVEPRRYAAFVRLLSASAAVVTDSSCVQEEACILGTPCVTVQNATERSETTEVGANRLGARDPDGVCRSVTEALESDGEWENPYGTGGAAERVLGALPVDAERGEIVR
ncbi:non-hydrolyzing UDP-N-acetylglucosamine 2-epimerase [Halorubrum sp. Eb13]|uniref:non-hydrolyzing UDP-N-acetylglucosamine 2-epimerase n=1 Tax=Halorubrum sp. Eb13 TaxID=1383843 RepID=UPI000B98743A|nr:UDP-N-acetylglucosamine 2-epimerase (non-hydrolyzing) [Halorubrum sp. Eb13]OYR48871.1 UDP-N-acetylglucosamine 2-epimerase (non-hydrolyzing) [Halorubrum sp. Eb13]